jgi:pantothenate kinase
MRRRRNLHTRFIQFLMESEKSNLNQFKDETDMEEVEKIGDTMEDEVDADDEKDEVDADEVIERLVQKLNKSKKEYDDIIHGRKRK